MVLLTREKGDKGGEDMEGRQGEGVAKSTTVSHAAKSKGKLTEI